MEMQKFKINFFTKLSISFGAICVIPIVVLGVFAYFFFYELSFNNLKAQVKFTMIRSSDAFDRLMEDYGQALQKFCDDPEVQSILQQKFLSSKENSQIYSRMFSWLKRRDLAAAMFLMGDNGVCRMSTIGPPKEYDISVCRNWGIYRAAGNSHNVVVYPNVYVNSGGKAISLSLVKGIRNKKGQVIGYAIVDMPTDTIAVLCNKSRGSLPISFTIIDQNYYIIYDEINRNQKLAFYNSPFRDEFKTEKSWRFSRTDKKRTLIWDHRFQNGQFFLLGTLHMGMIIENVKAITFVTLGIGLLSFILCVILSVLISKSISRPIHAIVTAMQKVKEGRFDVRVNVRSRDEIGFMANRFNDMVKEIDDLFHTNLEKQDRLRLAEIQSLQSQINPHFLYNTLDSIKWLAKLNGVNEIEAIVIHLGKLLKNTIHNQNEMVTIQESMEVIQSYLTIQKIRYSDRFEINMDIDPNILECYVPRLIIQPIVENAIIHGIVKKMEAGKLWVKANQEGGELRIEVVDDGVGINDERLRQIHSELAHNNGKGQNIGIYNVNRRIKLYYGEKYGVTIFSEIGKGTKVVLMMPIQY